MCNPFSQISNSFPRISNSFPRIGQLVLSDCNSTLELDNPFSRIAIRSLELDNSFSRIAMCNSRERLATRANGLANSRELIAIRKNGLSNSRERIAIRENEFSNSRERIVQFDITIYLWLSLKIPMSLQGFRTFVRNDRSLDFVCLLLLGHLPIQVTWWFLASDGIWNL